jgi:putative ABC transport system permease protein
VRFLHLVVRNLARNRRRTALTVLSLSIALFLYVFFDTVFQSWSRGSEAKPETARRLIVRNVSMTSPMPLSHRKLIAEVEGVESVAPWHWFNGRLKGRPKEFFPTFAVELESFPAVWSEFAIDPALRDEWRRTRRGAVIGRKLAQRFGWTKGSRLVLESATYSGIEPELEVVGLYSGGRDEESLFFQRDYLQELMRGSNHYGQVGMFYVVVSDPEVAARVADDVDKKLAGSEAPTRTESEKEFVLGLVSMIGDVKSMVMKVTAVVIGVVLLVVANALVMSVRERTREIAVLKALGFTPQLVIALVVSESVLVSELAGVLGCVGARVLFENVLGRPTVLKYFSEFSPPWSTVGTGLAIAGMVGVLSAVVPAWLAARIDVAHGLRRVG